MLMTNATWRRRDICYRITQTLACIARLVMVMIIIIINIIFIGHAHVLEISSFALKKKPAQATWISKQ